MVFLRKSKKRMGRKNMSKKNMSRKNMSRKNIHRGGQDTVSDEEKEMNEKMFEKRIKELANQIGNNIDELTNDQVKEILKQDPEDCRIFARTTLRLSDRAPADETENNFDGDEWAIILRLIYPTWSDSVESFGKMTPVELYDYLMEMIELASSKPSNKQTQALAKHSFRMIVYMSDTLNWSMPEDRNNADDKWKLETLKAATTTDNHFFYEGNEYDPLIHCAKNYEEYEKFIDRIITMDEGGDLVLKDQLKDMQSGGNRRKRISRRRRPLFSFLKKEEAKPKEPEVFKGEFENCNTYLQCLADGKSRNCDNNLDHQLLPTDTKKEYNDACRKYKFYDSVSAENDRWAKNGKKYMRSYLEDMACSPECERYLKADTMNWNYLTDPDELRPRNSYPPKAQ